MALNFNVDPYYDDFDPSKNFHRILFKPGKAVQARELTQSQTILQDQISKFASHIFTQNTPVNGGKITTNLTCSFIKLNTTYSGSTIVASDFLNKIIQNSSGTVIAKVIATAEATGTSTEPGDPPTLIVNYFSGVKFSDAETITVSDGSNLFATTIGTSGGTTCTGFSSVASISDGVFYVVNGYSISSTQNEDGTYTKYSIGNFVSVTPQTVILSKYSRVPSVRVGLEINETVVDYIDDASLLDPAIGASNYQAPGADRYKISLDLVTLPLSLGSDSAFIELMRIDSGKIIKQVDSTSYARLDDYFAKRDYEAHGNYVVNDFKLTPSQHPGDSNYYDLSVGKGIAYVNGYRIENQSDLTLVNPRARDTKTVIDNLVYVDYGSYFYVDNLNQTFDVTTLPQVDLHCVDSASINTTSSSTYSSTWIGTGRIRNLVYVDDSSDSNTQTYVYKSYVSDIDLNSLSGNSTSSSTSTTIQFFNTGNYSGVTDAYVGLTIAITGGTANGDRRTITAWNASTRTATVDSAFTVNPDTTTQFVLLFGTKDTESIVQKTSDSVFTLTASSEINALRGKVNGISTGDTVLENPSAPELLFNIGSNYVSELNNVTYYSTKVFRDKTFTSVGPSSSLTLTMPAGASLQFSGSGTLSADAAKQLFIVIDQSTGYPLDFASSGNTITITGGSTATLVSPEYAGKTVDVICNTIDVNGDATNLVLKSKNLVTGNTSIVSNTGPSGIISNTYIDLTNGQVYVKSGDVTTGSISLYVTDVKQVVKIINTKSANTEPTIAMLSDPTYDVTNLFTLDNGQRDTYYDHASIYLKPGASKPIGNILVIFDYYSHDGGDGYFSINSYLNPISTSPESYAEIPSYTSKNGTQYNLTNCVDFRASRVNATSSFIFEYTGDPSTDDTGTLIPSNLTNFNSDYSFYLGRFDKLVLTKDREFLIVNGYSDVNPQLPVEPDGSMVLAELLHDPYTAYIPGEGPAWQNSNLSINKIVYKRWTKDEITQLQTRVENLEYYTSFSLLEQNASSLTVLDDNGLNRFKNGILVDDFSSYATADTYSEDFVSNINIRKQQLTPLTDVQNFQLQNPVVLDGLGTVKQVNNYAINNINGTRTNLFTLPYTTANVVTQPLASSSLSVNPFSVVQQQGVLKLNPPMDNWLDTDVAPQILTNSPSYQISQVDEGGLNAINAGDFASIVGTPLTTGSNRASTRQTQVTNNNYNSPVSPVGQTTTTALSVNNGFVVNSSILPYIRQQQVIVRAKGLLVNSPISCWFDGYNVNDFMSTPNSIELTNVSGTFNEDDIVGFYYDDKFHFVGRVVSVYNYSATKVRLYVACIEGHLYAPSGTQLQNASFAYDGSYTGTTAAGDILGGSVTNIHVTGTITGVGNTFTLGSTTSTIYRIKCPNNWGTFLNQYGSWGDLEHDSEGNSTNPYSESLTVNFPATGTYTFTVSSSGSSTTQLDGSTIVSHSSPTTVTNYSASVSSGNHTIAWSATNSTGPAGYALVIKNSSGTIIFDTTNLSDAVTLEDVDSYYQMPGGGYWYSGATKIKLESNASANADYYVGSTITVTATNVQKTVLDTATYVAPPLPPTPPAPPVTPPPPDYYTYDDWIIDPSVWGQTTSGGNIPLPTSRTKSIGISLANTYYKGQFGRLPDSGGLAYWTNVCITQYNGNAGDATLGAAILYAGSLNGEDTYTGGAIKTNGSGGDFWDKA